MKKGLRSVELKGTKESCTSKNLGWVNSEDHLQIEILEVVTL